MNMTGNSKKPSRYSMGIPQDVSIDDIGDISMQNKVKRMIAVLPGRSIRAFQDTLKETGGDSDDAVDMIFRREEHAANLQVITVTSVNRNKGIWDAHDLSPILNSSNDMIGLHASDGSSYMVHKRLLSHFSSYYDAALYGEFREAKNTYVELDLNHDQADKFVCWLYSGHILESRPNDLFCLYVFADKTDILALRRSVMSKLVKEKVINMTYSWANMAADCLPESSPLYKYLVNWYVHHWIPSEEESSRADTTYEEVPKEFLHAVMCGLSKRIRATPAEKKLPCPCCSNVCDYHEHTDHKEWNETCLTVNGVMIEPREYGQA